MKPALEQVLEGGPMDRAVAPRPRDLARRGAQVSPVAVLLVDPRGPYPKLGTDGILRVAPDLEKRATAMFAASATVPTEKLSIARPDGYTWVPLNPEQLAHLNARLHELAPSRFVSLGPTRGHRTERPANKA